MSEGLPVAPGTDSRGSLWQAFARAVRDNVFAEIALQVVRIGGMIVLARALMPGDFGIFRILMIVMFFATIPVEGGVTDALIQRKHLLPEHEATGWWMCVTTGALMAAVIYAAAPVVARIMQMPALSPSVRLLCIPLALEGCAMTSSARLKRELRFGAVAMAEVLSEVVFLVVAIVLLWQGYPRWSLPGGYAARLLFYTAALLVADRRFVLQWPKWWAARDLARFTTSVWGARVLYVASENADFILIGRLLGSSALGYYGMAWDLLRFVPDRLHKVAGRVTFPAFARMQDDNEEMAHAFREFTAYLARFVLPVMALAFVAAPEFIAVVYGAKWTPTVVPLRLLSIGFTLVGVRTAIGSVFYSKDHPSFDIYLHGVRLVVLLATVIPLAALGLNAVSAGMTLVEGTVSILGLYLACRLIDLGLGHLFASFVPGVWLALFCLIAAIAGREIGVVAGLEPGLILLLEGALPGIVFLWLEAPMFAEMISKAFGSAASEAA